MRCSSQIEVQSSLCLHNQLWLIALLHDFFKAKVFGKTDV